ncbi:MAG: LuxR C-terminal-related transcriptional regulator [Pseudomonadota bacterium]
MNAALLATPERAASFWISNYYRGNPWAYLPPTWPADDPVVAQVSRQSTPVDYLAALRAADRTTSVTIQLSILKLYGVRRAWLIPLNTLNLLRVVTVYMTEKHDNIDAVFHSTRDHLAALSGTLIDTLDTLHRTAPTADSETLVVDRMPVALSDRELSCLSMVGQGMRNEEIAEELGISENTVRYHLKRVYKKINVKTRVEAVAVAIDQGLIGL